MTAVDLFKKNKKTYDSSSSILFTITPHDINELTYITRAIYVGVPGNVAVQDINGNDVTFSNAPSGLQIPIRLRKIYATGTTAGALIGLV